MYVAFIVVGILFAAIVLLVAVYYVARRRRPVPQPMAPAAKRSTWLPYRKRDGLLTPAEMTFYRELQHVVADRAVICPKVRLADIIDVAAHKERRMYLNRIIQKHVDFVLCDPTSMMPVVVLELNDGSHRRKDRRARDAFVAAALAAAELPLVTMPVQPSYQAEDLKAVLAPHLPITLQTSAEVSLGPDVGQSSPSTEAPLCPKCGMPMVVRVARRGKHQGKRFYACPNFPRCREVAPLEASV